MNLFQNLGLLGLASRIRNLAEELTNDGISIYQLAGVDFNPRWFGIYFLLLEHGELTITELAQRLGQSHPATIKVVNPMIKTGIIDSKKDANDGRKRIISLSIEGRDLEPKIRPVWTALEEALKDMFFEMDIDILAVLSQVEREIQQEPVSKRFQKKFRENVLRHISFESLNADNKKYFRSLNETWLQKFFSVEAEDLLILDSPEQIVEQGGWIRFASYENEIIATLAVIKHENSYEIAKMSVREEWQNRGVGRRLLEDNLKKLKDMEVKTVWLQTSPILKAAKQLYQSLGFVESSMIPGSKYERKTIILKLDL